MKMIVPALRGKLQRNYFPTTRTPPSRAGLNSMQTIANFDTFPPSSSQGAGHFPESSPYTETSLNAYYPSSSNGGDSSVDPSYICSPHSTLVAVIVIILVINVAMVAAVIIFYRQKRKHWSKRVGAVGHHQPEAPRHTAAVAPPPPIPSRPSSSTSGVVFKVGN